MSIHEKKGRKVPCWEWGLELHLQNKEAFTLLSEVVILVGASSNQQVFLTPGMAFFPPKKQTGRAEEGWSR